MDLHLARTSTNGSDNSVLPESPGLTPALSESSASSSKVATLTPRSITQRTLSTHSLLAPSSASDLRRKPNAKTDTTSTARASISMPPPITKPTADRRLSATIATPRPSRRSEDVPSGYPNSFRSVDKAQTPFANTPSRPTFTTNTDTTVVTTASSAATPSPGLPVLSPPALPSNVPNQFEIVASTVNPPLGLDSQSDHLASKPSTSGLPAANTLKPEVAFPTRTPRSPNSRSISSQRRLSTPSQKSTDTQDREPKRKIGTIGVCALDIKARSKPSRQILTRLQGEDEFEVVVFGDKAILDEDVANWPVCDFLISFFSQGFPLDKAIEYVALRKPFVVNDLQLQKVLWDRRLCLKILDKAGVRTPKRVIVNRDGGPTLETPDLARHVLKITGLSLPGPTDGTGGGEPLTGSTFMADDGDTLVVDGQRFTKPFVEKPVSGEDHNLIIYFPRSHNGGGARRLFRKIGNKSSEFDAKLITPRCITDGSSSYIYEQFLQTENAEDVKVYTVGPMFSHAETRKSPVVDGLVKRNTHGKEIRYVTNLSPHEQDMASRVSRVFGQRICGLDLLRAGGQSFVIDVNGFSFVKDNERYYSECAEILKSIFTTEKFKRDGDRTSTPVSDSSFEGVPRNDAAPNPGHTHRSALKTIFKSPSMKALSAHLSHNSMHTSSSPRISMAVPLSSPPSVERQQISGLSMDATSMAFSKSTESENGLSLPARQMHALGADDSKDDTTVENETAEPAPPLPNSKHSWKLKGVVTVIRHADRTPKQKSKLTAHSKVFADLLKGHDEEVLLKGEAALSSVEAAVKIAQQQGLEDQSKLRNFQSVLSKKKFVPATKVQIKPMFRKKPETSASNGHASEAAIPEDGKVADGLGPLSPSAESEARRAARLPSRSDSISGATFSRYAAAENDLILDKLQLVLKWGGEPTHAARHQSQDLGINMRDDYKLLNRKVLDNVRVFTSSEKRVKTSAQIWAAAFLGRDDISEDYIQVRKDLLDDSNAAKDVMDTVKRKLKNLLREGNARPEEFAWPKDVPEPYLVMKTVIELLKFHRLVMRDNFKKLRDGAAASLAALGGDSDNVKEPKEVVNVASIQARWCTGEDPNMFKERWEKLFSEFEEPEKVDPSKVSELYDSFKYEALHNRQFLEWVFTPSQAILDEYTGKEETPPSPDNQVESISKISRHDSTMSLGNNEKHKFAQKFGFRRKSVLAPPVSTPPLMNYEEDSYFKLFPGSGDVKSKQDDRLRSLRDLYRYAKILFDFISPQEYGISNEEKLRIGLLTSLPLLREIVADLEELQSVDEPKTFAYWTKESHIYTLLNCIMEGGIPTKIRRSAIPELDYLSQICFELYEATDDETSQSTYSIRISISPGCHTNDPLDISLDSKHAIGSAPRRSLTDHQDWKEVISTLKAKFDTVQLPKSFLAVNVSDKHEADAQDAAEMLQEDDAEVKLSGPRGRSEDVVIDRSTIDM